MTLLGKQSANLLPALGAELAAVAERVRASVVLVGGREHGAGSGVIWGHDGLIVTNHHVVARARQVAVGLADGRSFTAQVIAEDPVADLALLRINATGLAVASVRPSNDLRVGELVLAVGNPLGQRGAVSVGIVSGTTGMIRVGHVSRPVVPADVTLLPGNSGGALVDAGGRVVGINAMVLASGIALAIPSIAVGRFLAETNRPKEYVSLDYQ